MTEINKRILLFLILILFISSCASEIETTEQVSPTLISNTETPTTLPTVENTLSPTPESDTLIQVEKSCMNLENLPPDLELTGVWVRQSGKPYLENLEENIKYRIPLDGGGRLSTDYGGYVAISPNGEWLAYLDSILDTSERVTKSKGSLLRVIHSSGYALSMDYWPVNFQTIQGWIDNENLLLRMNYRNIVLNPFTGKWYEFLKPDWLEEKNDRETWFNPYQYSPRLDRIIEKLDGYSVLRDLASGKNLFGDADIGFFGSTWSLDGSMLFLTTGERGNETVYVLKDDKEILKANLAEAGVFIQGSNDFISHVTWSLDNQRVLLETYNKSIVFDINEQIIYEICFVDKNIITQWSYKDGFFSSKDGQYIIIQRSLINEKPYVLKIDILIDIEKMRAYRLPNIVYKDYIGWLALPQSNGDLP